VCELIFYMSGYLSLPYFIVRKYRATFNQQKCFRIANSLSASALTDWQIITVCWKRLWF